MANDLEALKNEMGALGDLESITKMMEQVAARDIARMRAEILESRRYFREVWKVYSDLKKLTPPLPTVIRKQLIVAIGIDWGMPGGLLNKTVEEAKRLQKLKNADMILAGKKIHNRYKGNDGHTVHYFSVPKGATLKDIQPIYSIVAGYAHVTFVYPKFETLSKQTITTATINIADEDDALLQAAAESDGPRVKAERFIVDPDPQTVADYLNEAVVGITVHHYFSEAGLAYSAAQMVAMRNGNNNAKDAVKATKEKYNRVRRANIDAKIRELSGGRAAQKKDGE